MSDLTNGLAMPNHDFADRKTGWEAVARVPSFLDPADIMDFCLRQRWEVIWTDSVETLNRVRQVGRLADSESVTAPAGQSKPGPAPKAMSRR